MVMDKIKRSPTLSIALVLTIVFEVVLMILVYQKIGANQLPTQLVRLGIQITLFLILIEKSPKLILYLLTFYHVFTAMSLLTSFFEVDLIGKSVVVYHVIMVFLIYFYKSIDLKLLK
jgi:hypothetical protein